MYEAATTVAANATTKAKGNRDRIRAYLWYCSSLTFSIQSTFFPSRDSVMAMCVIAVVGVAPCQCFNPAGNQTTSPGRTSSIGPPSCCTHPGRR
jgi:hypothetical protein